MGKFNDLYLKPALDSLQGSAENLLDSADSVTNRVNAESDAVRDKSRAERIFRENLSIGYKVFLILVGIGILSLLLAWASSIIINALKNETAAYGKLEVIEKQITQSDETLKKLSNSINSTKYVTPSDLKDYVSKQENILADITAQTSNLVLEWDLLQQELMSLKNGVTSQSRETPPNYSGYSLQKFTENETSTRCYENKSFKARCKDSVEFSNGWRYSGNWLNGQPDGDGTLTFPGGATMEANWKAGIPIEVTKSDQGEQKILKSITYFQNFSANSINSKFGNVWIGYNFDSGTDETWKSAYCYITIMRGNEEVKIDLSSYKTFSSSRKNYTYNYSNLITGSEFRKAQDLCKYKRSGFN